MQNLKKNWLAVWKMIWGIWQMFVRTLESTKIGTFMGSFCSKKKMDKQKIYRRFMCTGTEEWWKIWRGIDLSFQNWHKEFDKFWLENSKVSKVYTLMGSFWPKYIMFELKKIRRVIFHDIRVWYTWHLKKSWLVVWKIAWGIWQILSSAYESLKIGTFIGSFYTK